MNEKQKMLAGQPYLANDPMLTQARNRARCLIRRYNQTTEEDLSRRTDVLAELLGEMGDGVWIEPPFYCDYGSYISLGNNVYMNFNCVILDCNWVRIGAHTMLGPAVQIYAASHSLDAAERCAGPELAFPVSIGSRVWIGGGAIILPGVTIGDDTTIGAGSVVGKDIPSGVLAAGNPCRVIRRLV